MVVIATLAAQMSEGYDFDAPMQEQAQRVGQEAILKLLEGKTYQHGKVSAFFHLA